MDLGLKDKVALVTGAGSQIGYGKGTALTLAGEGCNVAVVDINLEGAQQTGRSCTGSKTTGQCLKRHRQRPPRSRRWEEG